MTYGAGSTGYFAASRVRTVIDTFKGMPAQQQSTGVWQTLWTNRTTIWIDATRDYIVGGGEANASSGWYHYVRRLHNSTLNTSTASASGNLGLPDPVWSSFSAKITSAISSESWASSVDANLGRIVHKFRNESGQFRELLEAWAGHETSEVPSS